MTPLGIIQIGFYFLVLLALTKPLGLYMARVFQGERTFLHPVLRPLERLAYRFTGVKENSEQHWTQYTASVLAFGVVCFLFTYLLQRLQGFLPFNPQGYGAAQTTPDLSFNTAVSFMTNTNWQAYGGEATLSYLVQMAALTVQNFLSAAAGIAVAIALIRGFARQQANSIGSFWVDTVRATVYVLLPLALVGALFLGAQGVVQNFSSIPEDCDGRGRHSNDSRRPGGLADCHQAAGKQWRRFLQCELGSPFRKPDRRRRISCRRYTSC